MIKLETPAGVFQLAYSAEALAELKKFAKFDPASKTWHAEAIPCFFARRFLPGAQCVDGRWWRGYAYIHDEPPREKVCYRVKKWRLASCREYCEERCGISDRCFDRCVGRCEEEGWTPRLQDEVEVCLAKKTERGDWQVPRGLIPQLGVKMPRYAELPSFQPDTALRQYQAEVLQSLWAQLSSVGAGMVQMATGAGKSYTAGYLAKKLAEAGYHVFLVALQIDLINQLAEFAEKWGAPREMIHTATVQTLYRRVARRDVAQDAEDEEDASVVKAYADESRLTDDEFRIFTEESKVAVVLDEAHHVPARTVKEVLSAAGDGWALRVGLTATPWRNDGRDLEIYAYSGTVVEPRISSTYLIRHGYAVPVEIRVVDAPRCTAECRQNGGAEGFACVRRALAECEARNRLIAELAAGSEKPVLVTTKLVSHAEMLYDEVRRLVPSAALATGAVKGEERKAIYDEVRRGEIDVLVATTIAEEGLDIPALRTMILAMADKSKTRTLQRAGRLVRPWQGKERGVLYELRDKAPFFKQHLEERLALYATEPGWAIHEQT